MLQANGRTNRVGNGDADTHRHGHGHIPHAPLAARKESNGTIQPYLGCRKNSTDNANLVDVSTRRQSNSSHDPSIPASVFEKRRSSFSSEHPVPSSTERRGSIDLFEGHPLGNRRPSVNPLAPKLDAPSIRTDDHETDGSMIVLECHVTSDSQPTVEWFHLDEAVKGSRYKRELNKDGEKWLSSLCIKDISRKDAGKYTVRAKNAAGETFATVFSYVED